MDFHSFKDLKNDTALKNKFYNIIWNKVYEDYVEGDNIAKLLVNALSMYNVEDDNELDDFNKNMPGFFKDRIQKLYKDGGYFFNEFKKNKKSNGINDFL